jgi:hypothetical protein
MVEFEETLLSFSEINIGGKETRRLMYIDHI